MSPLGVRALKQSAQRIFPREELASGRKESEPLLHTEPMIHVDNNATIYVDNNATIQVQNNATIYVGSILRFRWISNNATIYVGSILRFRWVASYDLGG
jgi:hypothetical protein